MPAVCFRSFTAACNRAAASSSLTHQGPRALTPGMFGQTHGTSFMYIRGSIVVSTSACHAEDPGSIPDRGGVNTAPLTIEQIQLSALGLQWQAPDLSTIMLRLREHPVYLSQ